LIGPSRTAQPHPQIVEHLIRDINSKPFHCNSLVAMASWNTRARDHVTTHMLVPHYLFIYPTSGDSDPLQAARRRILRTCPGQSLGVLKIGSPEVSLYAVFTVRQDCRAAIPH
jgi:hypothetical protein